MKSRENPSAFDSFDEFKEIRESNRQNAYENKVCRKLVARMFPKGSEDREYWVKRLEASREPLVELNEVLEPFRLHSKRMQSWSINDLLKNSEKIMKSELWQEFAVVIDNCAKITPMPIPAMIFYNSAIEQDMVLHTASDLAPPKGYARIVRTSSSGDGVVVLDTLEGFMAILGYRENEVQNYT
jgi:hypothetical protein